jgi:alanine racemase
MDQLLVDATALDPPVARGDEVVLIGAAGSGAGLRAGPPADPSPDPPVTANEWAARLGTIGYEVVTRLGPRLPRRYRGGQP